MAEETKEGGIAETIRDSEGEKALNEVVSSAEVREERVSGKKMEASNISGMLAAKDEIQGNVKIPSFFVRAEERVRVEVDILFRKTDGHILNVALAELKIDFSKVEYLGHSREWFEFSQPKYDDMASYRQQSMVFNQRTGKLIVDPVKLRNFLIVFHLKGWSIRSADGVVVPLTFAGDSSRSALTGECLNVLDSIHPTVIDVIMSKFEVEILLQ